MPSYGENRLVRVTHTYQTQVGQCKKLGNGMNGVHHRAFEIHGRLQPQQCLENMGEDTGDDNHSNFDSANDEKNEHEQAGVVNEGSEAILDLRNRIARQWRYPAFAWKALEAMPVRNLFRVSQSSKEQKPSKEADNTFVKTGNALFSAVEDGGISKRKLVTIVLAFQRWRRIQLKNILGQELRKVLEEAREDETALAALETELEHKEQQLASARANSLRLRCQLAATINYSSHENGYSADNATIKKAERVYSENQVSKSSREMMRTMEGLKEAETEIQWRDNQIQQLKERIRFIEDQSGRVDGQLRRLQAEHNSAVRENRALLEQLSSRDKKVIKQVEEMERLKALAARLVEQQNSKHDQIESIMAEHTAEVKTLQEQLRHACGAKHSKEVDLARSVEHCSHLKQEDTLMLQLQEAEKWADLESSRAQELRMQLQCTRDDRAIASEGVASEMVEHLKKLTDHVRELEGIVIATGTQPASSQADGSTIGNEQDQRQVSSVCDHELLERPSALEHSFQEKIENWITWKWRWAASTTRAELLANKLHGFNQKVSEGSHPNHKQHKVQELMERLRTGNLTTSMENELNTMVAEHKLVPLILSAWRAFTRTRVLERKAISRSALLDKMLEALPWWIRRTTLEQEVTELQKILCQKTRPSQRHSTQTNGKLANAPTTNSHAKEHQPEGEKVLKSVLGVCNNLALALTNVRGKLSPRVLADTVIACSRNERTKQSNGMSGTSLLKATRQLLEGQSPKSSPRTGLVSGRPVKSRNPQGLEGLGTQIVPPSQINSHSRKPTIIAPAQDIRDRITVQGAEEKAK